MKQTAIIQLLQDHGLRPSPQRVAVADYLASHKTHPTAETVYTALSPRYPTLSRTTVYQTLQTLCDIGAAQKITIEDGEMRFDADTSDHGHFKCVKCDRVFDFFYPAGTAFPKPGRGFLVERSQLYSRGLCPDCAAKRV
jgi:Fur family peroxide stress response transcriptional regulator